MSGAATGVGSRATICDDTRFGGAFTHGLTRNKGQYTEEERVKDSQGHALPGPDDQRRIDETIQRGQRYHYQALEALKRGQRDLATRDLDRAVVDYTEVLRIDPNHLTAYLYRARAYEEMGEDEKAEADLTRARELETD